MALSLLFVVGMGHAIAKDKIKKEVRVETPEPDRMPSPLKPQARIYPAAQVGQERTVLMHTASDRTGIDVSHYQGNINWNQVRQDGKATFAYLKATESTGLKDDTYRRNVQGARQAGIPVGAYHFFSPSQSGKEQLQNFLAVAKPEELNLIPMIDVETRGKLSLSTWLGNLKQFIAGVEKAFGVKPIIYTGQNFYNKYLAGHFLDYKFMIAKYSEGIPELVDAPKFVLWQFSASGQVQGIKGSVDCSRFMDNYSLTDILLTR